jgi:membrane-associated phospholipid phosphatase
MRWFGGARAVQGIVLLVAMLAAATGADEALHDLVFRHVVSHEIRLLANGVTLLGTFEVTTGGLLGLAIVALRTSDVLLWQGAVGALAGVTIGGLATQAIKHVGCRARPRLVDGWGVGPPGIHGAAERLGFFHWPCLRERGYDGFPSGHAMIAFAVASALLGCVPAPRCAALLVAGGVALSRIVLNAHFLSDVMVGGLVGWWAGEAGVWLATRYTLSSWRVVARSPQAQRTPLA